MAPHLPGHPLAPHGPRLAAGHDVRAQLVNVDVTQTHAGGLLAQLARLLLLLLPLLLLQQVLDEKGLLLKTEALEKKNVIEHVKSVMGIFLQRFNIHS